jgi:hypothetical protein
MRIGGRDVRGKGRDWVNVVVAVLAIVGAGFILYSGIQVARDAIQPKVVRAWAPSVSAAIAAAGLLLTAYTYNRATMRLRRAATMEAWENWQEGTRKLRRRLLEGTQADTDGIGDAEASMLLKLRRRTERSAPDDVTKAQISRVHDITTVLNGLERIAAGCSSGLYDRNEVARIGRTIVIRNYERWVNFIDAARTDAGPKGNLKQPKSFAELEALYTWLKANENP